MRQWRAPKRLLSELEGFGKYRLTCHLKTEFVANALLKGFCLYDSRGVFRSKFALVPHTVR
jgi:hypothetical protein